MSKKNNIATPTLTKKEPWLAEKMFHPIREFAQWWQARATINNTKERLFIIMERTAGDWDAFYVIAEEEAFTWSPNPKKMAKQYVIDHKAKFYFHPAKCYALLYHEDLTLPVVMRIDVNTIRKKMDQAQIETAINPSNLKRFQDSAAIKKALEGAQLEERILAMEQKLLWILLVVIGIAGYLVWRLGMKP